MDEMASIIQEKDIKAFEKKGITTIEELTHFYPRKYIDFTNIKTIEEAAEGESITVIGKVELVSVNSGNIVTIKLREENNNVFYVVLFGRPMTAKNFIKRSLYFFSGHYVVDEMRGDKRKTIQNPILFGKVNDLNINNLFYPIYSKVGKIPNETIRTYMKDALAADDLTDYLTEEECQQFKLVSKECAYAKIHFPKNEEDMRLAKRRILFDDLYFFAKELSNQGYIESTDKKFIKNDIYNDIIKKLPFQLTNDQQETVNTLLYKSRENKNINCLVQGDVGSGKTIVAFLLMVLAAENGFQAALMAPTSVLALQHYNALKELVEKYDLKVGLLCGEQKASEKKQTLKLIEKGEILLVVGTHALISENIKYANLGIVINDEEHRFGVAQKDILKDKGKGVHYIACTGTPIPRTLALTVYGENTDVFEIKTMPAGRKPIKTKYTEDIKEVYSLMDKEISSGRQCYIVCPLIEESEYEPLKDICSAEQAYEEVKTFLPTRKIGIISGKMKQQEITEIITAFVNKEYDVLVSTTIIEVGVNVPNASVIVIRDAQRFGLAQLHQLRGRVGRGNYQGYCILNAPECTERLKVMTSTTDGFKISEEDLKIRGTGELTGIKQSGYSEQLEQALRSPKTFSRIKELVKRHNEIVS